MTEKGRDGGTSSTTMPTDEIHKGATQDDSSDSDPDWKWRRRLLLFAVLSASFTFNLSLQILTVSLPDIQASFNTSASVVAWVSLAASVASTATQPLAGAFADKYGAIFVWYVGVVIVTASIVMSAASTSVYMLILARGFTGLGTGLTVPAGVSLISLSYRKIDRARPLSLQVTILNTASAIGIVLSGVFAQLLSWQYIFLLQIPFATAPVFLGMFLLRVHITRAYRRLSKTEESGGGTEMSAMASTSMIASVAILPVDSVGPSRSTTASAIDSGALLDPPVKPGRKIDYAGCLSLSASTLSIVLFVNLGGQLGWNTPTVIVFGILAGFSTGFFFWWERRAPTPFIPHFVMKDPLILLTFLIRWCSTSVYFGSFIVLPYYLRLVHNCSALEAALVLLARIVSAAIFAYAMGRLVKRSRYSLLIRLSALLFAVSYGMFIFLHKNTGLLYIFIGCVLQGAANGVTNTTLNTLSTSRVPNSLLSSFSGAQTTTWQVVMTIGMAIMFAIVEHTGNDQAKSYRRSFSFAFGLSSVGLILSSYLAYLLNHMPENLMYPEEEDYVNANNNNNSSNNNSATTGSGNKDSYSPPSSSSSSSAPVSEPTRLPAAASLMIANNSLDQECDDEQEGSLLASKQ